MNLRLKFLSIYILLILLSFSISAQIKVSANDAVFLNYQTNLQIKGGRLYANKSYELQINNRQGEGSAEISIPYSKMNRVSKLEACIKDRHGIVVRKLSSSDIIDRSTMADFSLYEDRFVKEFTLVHNEYPYTIYYSYQEQQDAFFYIDYWTPVVDKNIPVRTATLTLEVPLDYKVAYTSQFVDSFKVDTTEKQIKYRWRASYITQVVPEIYAPDLSVFIPKVEIVPLKFKYDKEGMQNTWAKYGQWEYSLIEGLNDLPEDEKREVDLLIKGVVNDIEKVKILYHYLQDATRYINVSIKTGGIKPYPASYVSINKYGDCKALSNYFKSVLGYAGIKSFYTNIHAGDEIRKINMNFPSMQFNHVIICVPLPNDTVWLDCTSDGPFNYLGTFTQQREAFLIDKENSHFTKTPSLSEQDVLVTRNIHIHNDSSYITVASFHNKYRGKSFESLSDLSRSVSESKKAQIIRNDIIESNLELIDYKFIPVNRDSAFIFFDYTAKADNLFKRYGNDQLIGLIPFHIPHFKELKIRKYPVQIDFPIYKIDTLYYQIPLGYMLTKLPQNQNIKCKFGDYNIQFKQKKYSVEVIKRFLLYSRSYPVEQYKEFYEFISNVSGIENNSYIITSKNN